MPDDTAQRTKPQATADIHILPLGRKRGARNKGSAPQGQATSESRQETQEKNFSTLTHKLERRLNRFESELKDSLKILEHDLHKAVVDKKAPVTDKELKSELSALSEQLERRVQKTLEGLSRDKSNTKADHERLEGVKRLVSQLTKILSFDFYKRVVDMLGTEENQPEVDPFGMDPALVAKIRPIFDFFYYKYWRVTTTGLENIPADGRALLVANHSGTVPYDGAMIRAAILNEHPQRRDARYLVENFVYHMPILGTFMYRIGAVRACPENAELLLSAGHLVIVFPEGVKGIGKYYRHRYKLQRFGRGGFIKLCMKTKSPLIPVGIVGAEEIHPIIAKSNILAKTIGIPYIPITPTFPFMGLLGLIPLPSKWSIHFGKPVSFEDHGPKAVENELLIHHLSEKVRGDIQEIIFELLRKRRSVWTG